MTDRLLVDRPGLRVHAGPPVRITGSTETLAVVETAHAAIDSPHVPTLRRDGDALVVDVPAVRGLHEVVAWLGAEGAKIDYGIAIAFNELLMDATEAGHRAGYALGALAWSSVLAGADGRLWLLGFGFDGSARPAPTDPGACIAPELALGLPASPASDVFVLHAMLRTLLPYSTLPASYAATLTPEGRDAPLHAAMVSLAQRALAPDPALRPPDVAGLRALYRDIRPLAPDMPAKDRAGLERVVARAVSALGGRILRVEHRARTVTPPGQAPVELGRRALLWRLVERLLEAHDTARGEPLTTEQLVEAGWPDEKILPEAARTRLYTAIRSLRKAGLEEVLWSRDGGYL
ncbi:MAG: hypothetical protein KC619_05580, partial [Myxococcales bacterium]|nr:hypothetical protein [Myxococcales bacterium]